jgi:hypothetical protein
MPNNPKNTISTVIPAMRYHDANAAPSALQLSRVCPGLMVVGVGSSLIAHPASGFSDRDKLT